MTDRTRLWATSLVLALCLAPRVSFGQSADATPTVESILQNARELRKKNHADDAIQLCFKALELDRNSPEALDELRLCVRHALQSQRRRDPGFHDRVLAMSPSDALALYAEVLSKLQAHYVDVDKTAPARLFRQGLDEFLAALADPGFLERHAKNLDEGVLGRFRGNLQKAWNGREIASSRQAVEIAAEIASAAKRHLGFRSINPVLCEFICGACNSLDEYSAYLSPGQSLSEGDAIAALTVQVRIEEGGVAYMHIAGFQLTTPREVEAALKSFEMLGNIRALILDLRGNTGGVLTSAIATAEQFLPGGIIVTAQGQNDEANKVYTSTAGGSANTLPMVVLVDRETASAAEVLAVALRDNHRARLIGTATFGKGSVQKVVAFTTAEEVDPETGRIKPRAAVRITTARLIAPSGTPITGVGVTPDQLVPERERQYEAALGFARELGRRTTPTMMGMMRD